MSSPEAQVRRKALYPRPPSEIERDYIPNQIAVLRRRKARVDFLILAIIGLGITQAVTSSVSIGVAIVGFAVLGRTISHTVCDLYSDTLVSQWADLNRDMITDLFLDDNGIPLKVPRKPQRDSLAEWFFFVLFS